jgi:cell division protein FtsQ
MAVYGLLLAELDANNQHFSAQISEINLKDPEDAQVLMPEQGNDILAHFGEDRFLERYQRFQAHIGEWMQQYPKLAAVDLRYDQQVVLEMLPGSGPAQTAAEATATDPVAKTPANAEQASAADEPAANGKSLKTAPKPAVRSTQKPRNTTSKSAVAKDKAARDKKKRAAAARAALDSKKQKKAHTSATTRRGQ